MTPNDEIISELKQANEHLRRIKNNVVFFFYITLVPIVVYLLYLMVQYK